jgi:hypothetical protein
MNALELKNNDMMNKATKSLKIKTHGLLSQKDLLNLEVQ